MVTREPGSTPLSEQLRELLLGPTSPPISPWAEALLYTAARAQLVAEVIQPALARHAWVIADRYADSTIAYQGYGLGLDVKRLRALHAAAIGGLWPDLTFLFDVPAAVGLARCAMGQMGQDRIETRGLRFHDRVNDGYRRLAAAEPGRYTVVPPDLSEEEAHQLVVNTIEAYLAEVGP